MDQQNNKMNPLKKFFLICSGADLEILGRPECNIELNKYAGIGATIFSTALLASFSGGYALFTVFRSVPVAMFFGIVWGAIIFNLDRYIISTIRKKTLPPNLPLKDLLRWKLSEFAFFAPRLLLAIFISIIITRPIELKLFETEINKEILRQTSVDLAEMQGKIQEEFPEIDRLTNENAKLQQELADKRKQVDGLYELALAEGMGERRGNTTGRIGKGPFYEERMGAYERGKLELVSLERVNGAKIQVNENNLVALRKAQAERASEREPTIERNGLLARLKTLSDLSEKNKPIELASWFLMFLFIMLETAPIIVKILAERGPYDDIYETLEHSVFAAEQKKILEIDSRFDTDAVLSERLDAEILASELRLSRQTMESLETLAATEIMAAQTEIAQSTVEKWRKSQLKKLMRGSGDTVWPRNGNRPAPEPSVEQRSEPAIGSTPP